MLSETFDHSDVVIAATHAKAKKVWYEPHPISPERKKELKLQGYQIVDIVYAPRDARGIPITGQPGYDVIWLQMQGADADEPARERSPVYAAAEQPAQEETQQPRRRSRKALEP